MTITNMQALENGDVEITCEYFDGEGMATSKEIYTARNGLVYRVLENGNLVHETYKGENDGYYMQAYNDRPLIDTLKSHFGYEG